jgi:NAD(P)-dependent dehydrogenase (short-subunit alcohol dehydrogenase family)
MSQVCEGRVVIVTGAGRGIGREHALELARQGARVVVNDLGVALDGKSTGESPGEQVASELEALGAEAFANGADVADWAQTQALVAETLARFGRLDAVVNNAGFVRDRMFVSCTEEEWDAVLRVHLKGHFCLAHHACEHWRNESKAGRQPNARIVNTSSGAGLQGSVGQSAYSAAKGGIATLTLVQAVELARYGVTSNAIAPSARTRMTEGPFAERMKAPDAGFDAMHPGNIAPLVAWLCSAESRDVTGRVFEIAGGELSVADGWRAGPRLDKGARWAADEIGAALHDLLRKATPPQKVYGA